MHSHRATFGLHHQIPHPEPDSSLKKPVTVDVLDSRHLSEDLLLSSVGDAIGLDAHRITMGTNAHARSRTSAGLVPLRRSTKQRGFRMTLRRPAPFAVSVAGAAGGAIRPGSVAEQTPRFAAEGGDDRRSFVFRSPAGLFGLTCPSPQV